MKQVHKVVLKNNIALEVKIKPPADAEQVIEAQVQTAGRNPVDMLSFSFLRKQPGESV